VHVLCLFLSSTSGDFGGLFGLFLGGSAISMFEIFDLLIHIGVMEIARRVKPAQVKPQAPVTAICKSSVVGDILVPSTNTESTTITEYRDSSV
jgi:hypothetical protein